MQHRDKIFIGLLGFGAIALLLLATRRGVPLQVANVAVPDDTEIVGMSLSPDQNPPASSPFKGRYVVPPPLMSMMPSVSDNASEGTALNQKGYLQ